MLASTSSIGFIFKTVYTRGINYINTKDDIQSNRILKCVSSCVEMSDMMHHWRLFYTLNVYLTRKMLMLSMTIYARATTPVFWMRQLRSTSSSSVDVQTNSSFFSARDSVYSLTSDISLYLRKNINISVISNSDLSNSPLATHAHDRTDR